MNEFERIATLANHFDLFAIAPRYAVDRRLLEARYLELTRLTHPDAMAGDGEQELAALELSARVNEAYAVLSDDLRRAEYLLSLRHGAGTTERKVSPEMLVRVFDLREALSAAQLEKDSAAIEEVRRSAGVWLAELLADAGRRLDSAGADAEPVCLLLAAAAYLRRTIEAASRVP